MHSGKALELKEKEGWKGRLAFSVVGEEKVARGSVLWVHMGLWREMGAKELFCGWGHSWLGWSLSEEKKKKIWQVSGLFLLLFRDQWYLFRVRMKKAMLRRYFEKEVLCNLGACSVTLIVSTGGFRCKSVLGDFCLHTLSYQIHVYYMKNGFFYTSTNTAENLFNSYE